MKKFRIEDMTGGWFVGDFEPSALQTKEFEVGYKFHPKGEKWDTHYHKIITEVNFLIEGTVKIQNETFKTGDIFIIYPNEIADPEFIEDCKMVVVKIPSITNDKYIVDETNIT